MNTQKNIAVEIPSAANGKVQILKKVPKVRYKIKGAWAITTTASTQSYALHKDEPTGNFGTLQSSRTMLAGSYVGNTRIGTIMEDCPHPLYADELWCQVDNGSINGQIVIIYNEVRISPIHQRR